MNYIPKDMASMLAQYDAKYQKDQKLFEKCFNSKRIPRKLKKRFRQDGRWAAFCLAKILVDHAQRQKNIISLLSSDSIVGKVN